MREIGSEFWDVQTAEKTNTLFPETARWYLSGRSALQSILRELPGCRSVAMPSWCCDSMVKPFADRGYDVRFYPVYFRDGLVRELRDDCDVLLLMDYFGYTADAPDLSGYRGVVIRDVTHSLFSASHADAGYSFGSLRKWCGVWTGGFAWAGDGHSLPVEDGGDTGYTALRAAAMEQKSLYIHGRGGTGKEYLKVFAAAEERLEDAPAAPAAERDVRLAKQLDAGSLRARRRANAGVLRAAFPEQLIFPALRDGDCPMFVPILVPGGRRDALRRYLIQREIYCPVHWPKTGYHRLEEREQRLYDDGLSLVCDQRYDEDDMRRLAEAISAFWREG